MLTEEQREQLEKQFNLHKHDKYSVDIQLNDETILKSFIVHPNILRPEVTPALFLTRFLAKNKQLYQNKNAIDMGSGTGIQGIVMAQGGANHVTFSDIRDDCIENTKENIKRYGVEDKSTTHISDLFNRIPKNEKFDVIVFNHPFFPGEPIKDIPVSSCIMDGGELIHCFFEQIVDYLKEKSILIMPFFHLAGDLNDPGIQAPKHGFKIKRRHKIKSEDELNKGDISIYEIERD